MTAPAAREVDPRVGTVLARKYRLGRRLGAGAMGAVYEAENLQTGRVVAVKLLLRESPGATARARFLREARAAAQLHHDHIVDVLDMDDDPATGLPFIVQEHLVGEDLRRLLDARGRLPPDEALAILLPALRALAFAHERGIIHRDVKPENLFLARTPEGPARPKVIDFGVARWSEADEGDAKLTQTGAVLGTPYYMSPEQAKGDPLDARADVWSAGVVLYEMLAGRRPFPHAVLSRLLAAILVDPIPPLDAVVEGLPAGLARAVHGAMERSLDARFADMRAFIAALEEVARAEGMSLVVTAPPLSVVASRAPSGDEPHPTLASSTPPPPHAPPVATPSSSDAPERKVLPARTSPRSLALALAVALGAVAVAAWLRARPEAPQVTPVAAPPPPSAPSPQEPAPTPVVSEAPAPSPPAASSAPEASPRPRRPAPRVAPRPRAPTPPAAPTAPAPAARPLTNGAPVLGL